MMRIHGELNERFIRALEEQIHSGSKARGELKALERVAKSKWNIECDKARQSVKESLALHSL